MASPRMTTTVTLNAGARRSERAASDNRGGRGRAWGSSLAARTSIEDMAMTRDTLVVPPLPHHFRFRTCTSPSAHFHRLSPQTTASKQAFPPSPKTVPNQRVHLRRALAARAAARAVDEERDAESIAARSRVPISVKDHIDIAGHSTTAASNVRRAILPFATRPSSTDSARRAPSSSARPTCTSSRSVRRARSGVRARPQPADPTRSAGGSSGGPRRRSRRGWDRRRSGRTPAGSIRIPAAACGVVGLKPSLGEVPTDGVVPLCSDVRSRRPDHALRGGRGRAVVRSGRPCAPSHRRVGAIADHAWRARRLLHGAAGRRRAQCVRFVAVPPARVGIAIEARAVQGTGASSIHT